MADSHLSTSLKVLQSLLLACIEWSTVCKVNTWDSLAVSCWCVWPPAHMFCPGLMMSLASKVDKHNTKLGDFHATIFAFKASKGTQKKQQQPYRSTDDNSCFLYSCFKWIAVCGESRICNSSWLSTLNICLLKFGNLVRWAPLGCRVQHSSNFL